MCRKESEVAPSNGNGLKAAHIRGGMSADHEDPNDTWDDDAAPRVSQIPASHSEVYLEPFPTIYAEVAVTSRDDGWRG